MDTLAYIAQKYALNLKAPSPITIPGLTRIALASLFNELDFMTGAEIGVQNGKYSRVLLEANPKLLFYAIDPWLEYDELPIKGKQEDQDAGYINTVNRLMGYENCTVLRKKSMDAVADFPDGFFDFVYIDGNHEFVSAAMDIHYWLGKIRVGGVIAGHDYRRYYPHSFIHVYQVVNAFTEAYRIKPWFTTDYVGSETVRSFFWVKDGSIDALRR